MPGWGQSDVISATALTTFVGCGARGARRSVSIAIAEFVRRLRDAAKVPMHQAPVEVAYLLALTVCVIVDSGTPLQGYFLTATFIRSLASQALQLVTDPGPRSEYVHVVRGLPSVDFGRMHRALPYADRQAR